MARHNDLGDEGIRRDGDGPRREVEDLLGLSAEDLEAIEGRNPQQAEADPSPAEQNVLQDRYDGRLFGELYEASREIRALAESEAAPETFPALLRDFFCAFYKAAPALAPEEVVEERHRRLNRPLVEGLLGDEKTGVVRLWTRLDPLSSGLATLAAGRRVLKEIAEEPEPNDPSRRTQDPPPEGTEEGPAPERTDAGRSPEGQTGADDAPDEEVPD